MSATASEEVTILGIDPGSRITGFGVIGARGDQLRYVAAGCVRGGDADFSERLKKIFFEVGALVEEHRPDEIAIERVFMNRNADSALKLGHARAAALCATFVQALPVHEYAAREIKKAVVGKGAADKVQVQHMMRVLLSIKGKLQPDAADALAVAVCHAHVRHMQRRLANVAGGGMLR